MHGNADRRRRLLYRLRGVKLFDRRASWPWALNYQVLFFLQDYTGLITLLIPRWKRYGIFS